MNATTAPVTSLIDERLDEIETRFQVQMKGRMWHIVDRVKGKTVGFDGEYRNALSRAEYLEKAHA
jgi:hypothetical protein